MGLFSTKKTTTTVNETNQFDQSQHFENAFNTSYWLQQNRSDIRNESSVQNLMLQNTDSFNRNDIRNLANVGNNVGANGPDPFLDSEGMAKIFDSVFSNPIVGITPNKIAADPNANPFEYSFAQQTDSIQRNIDSLTQGLSRFMGGVVDLTKVSSPTSATNAAVSSPWFWPVVAIIVVAIAVVFTRK